MLVLKKNVHKPGHFQYAIHMRGNHFLVYGHKKDLPHITCIFHILKYVVKTLLVSAILHYISLLRLLPKSYFKISTFQPNFLCSSSFKTTKFQYFLWNMFYHFLCKNTVNSRYLKFQGTVKNSLKYPKFELSELRIACVHL